VEERHRIKTENKRMKGKIITITSAIKTLSFSVDYRKHKKY